MNRKHFPSVILQTIADFIFFAKVIIYFNINHYEFKKESLPHGRNVVARTIEAIEGYEALHGRFVRTMSITGKSRGTIENYGRHVASIALHFGRIPLDLSVEEVHAYLYALQKRAKTPSQSYFKQEDKAL